MVRFLLLALLCLSLMMPALADTELTHGIGLSPDGRWLVASNGYMEDSTIQLRVWDLPKKALVKTLTLKSYGHELGFTKDGKHLVASPSDIQVIRTSDWSSPANPGEN